MYQHVYYPYHGYPRYRGGDQRFFPFFGLPFLVGGLAGLAISPFLFNRPCYGPACYPPPYPPYGGYPYPYPSYPQTYGGNTIQSQPYNFTENINIYPQG